MFAKLRHDADFYPLMYVVLALAEFLAFCGQGIGFAFCSEQLVYHVRSQAFRAMLNQDVSFFENNGNTASALTSILPTETAQLAGVSGVTLGTLLIVTTTLVAAVSVASSFAWKLALVCTAVMPAIGSCGFFRFWILAEFQIQAKASYQASGSYPLKPFPPSGQSHP
jgi:ATP-binding cassette, subfamily B (MDR/TAP), member 1